LTPASTTMNSRPTVSAPSPLSSVEAPNLKTDGNKRRRSADPVDREAKARERTLRNRAAAQVSRERKRRYMEELETTNAQLKIDNVALTTRLSTVEADNCQLSHKLDAVTVQLKALQSQMSYLARFATSRNDGATTPSSRSEKDAQSLGVAMTPELVAISSSPARSSTLCSFDGQTDTDLDRARNHTSMGHEQPGIDFGESAALSKLARERRANSLQRRSTLSSSFPSWPNPLALPVVLPSVPAHLHLDSPTPQPPPGPKMSCSHIPGRRALPPCPKMDRHGRISKRLSVPPTSKIDPSLFVTAAAPSCRPCQIAHSVALLTISLVWWTLNFLMRPCNRHLNDPHGTTRRLSTMTPTSFYPKTCSSISSSPPIPHRFIRSSKSRPRTISREALQRMVEWIRDWRLQNRKRRPRPKDQDAQPP